MAGVLDGLKVVSMEQWVVVPIGSVLLADWGADVIRIEPVTGEAQRNTRRVGGVSQSLKFAAAEVNPQQQLTNRNKRSLAVDLKKESGRNILCRLVEKADVFMSNYQLSTLEKLRLDYDTLSQLNPGLIYAFVNGYGSKGPDRDERAHDSAAAWARSGMQYMVSEPGSPPAEQPGGMGDRNASVHIIAGVLAALLHKEKTGKGQKVEICLFHSACWSLSSTIQDALSGIPRRIVPRDKSENPIHIPYRTRDDRWLLLYMPHAELYWSDVCRTIERPELENDPRFNNMETRRENGEELIRILDEVFASKTLEEWKRLCRKHHLVFSPVQTPTEVITDPQALANDFFVDLPHPAGQMKVLAGPIKFIQNPASMRAPAPEIGQHTEEILLDLGYSREDIARLKEQAVVL